VGRRVLPLAMLMAAAGLASSAPAAARPTFTLGVAAGEVTPSSALLWAHAQRSGLGHVQVARDPRWRRVVVWRAARVRRSADGTVQVRVGGLRPFTRYWYRFCLGRARSARGTFVTAPAPRSAPTIRFAWSGDADAQRARGGREPFYNTLGDRNFAVYRAMRRESNAFNVNLGDTIYSDSEVGAEIVGGVYRGFSPALTVAQKWAKYRQNIRLPNLQALRAGAGLYSHPDDHEWINDFGRFETLTARDAAGRVLAIPGRSVYRAGVTAFRDYAPVSYSRRFGFYRVFHWGRNLDLFFLDERSFRSAKAGSPTIHTCDNPSTGAPDLAPTAPPDKRALFAAVVPALRAPVSARCRATIDSPRRTMLGARQRLAFLRAIERSRATFKVVINEVPIQQLYALPYDRWEGYAYERRLLLRTLQRRVRNVIFLTTDDHANLVNVARYATFRSEGGPSSSGIDDVTTGPVATMTFKREINGALGQDPGTGTGAGLIEAAFFAPPPDAGLGMRCSAIDVFSYGEVAVTRTRLIVRLKDQHGRPVRQDVGAGLPCPPIVLRARR
jgi:phosphodiesterase/alkaline phosphatase D-like protein